MLSPSDGEVANVRAGAGLRVTGWWTDSREWFAVAPLERTAR